MHHFGRPFPTEAEFARVKARKLFSCANGTEGHLLRLDIGAWYDPIVSIYNLDWKRNWELYSKYEELASTGEARFKIVHYHKENLIELEIPEGLSPPTYVQSLNEGRYLIASTHGGTDIQNGWVVDADGAVVEKFPIGDCIEALQTTQSGKIWTGYHEEGVFGDDPLSHQGFSCFDQHGKLLFPTHFIDSLGIWCIGLNVESENIVWLYLSEALVKIENFSATKIREDYSGWGEIFAISGNYTCWEPPQYTACKGIDFFTLLDIESGQCRFLRAIDEHGNKIEHQLYAARGSKMYFTSNYDVYVLDLDEIDSLPALLQAGFTMPPGRD